MNSLEDIYKPKNSKYLYFIINQQMQRRLFYTRAHARAQAPCWGVSGLGKETWARTKSCLAPFSAHFTEAGKPVKRSHSQMWPFFGFLGRPQREGTIHIPGQSGWEIIVLPPGLGCSLLMLQAHDTPPPPDLVFQEQSGH